MSDAEAIAVLDSLRMSEMFPHLKGLVRIDTVRRHVSQLTIHRALYFKPSPLGSHVKYSRVSAMNAVFRVA